MLRTPARARWWMAVAIGAASFGALAQAPPPPTAALDRAAARWVDDTLKAMTLDDKAGQLVFTSSYSTYVATDSEAFAALAHKVRTLRLGGVLLFGGVEPVAPLLLGQPGGATILGQPLAAASLVNRLQQEAAVPLLTAADFESGAGFRIAGATVFPRQMAVAAAQDAGLAFDAARITAIEARALGIHVTFAPIADVNNNPRNPVINTRSFGESPDRVGDLAAAYVRGLQAGGAIATVKHFPGHGDTDVDSHIGLPIVPHPRDRLDAIELAPFRAALAAGAGGVMTAHIQLPALDASAMSPATLSAPIVTGLLRGDMKFDGLVFTDSMSMDAIARQLPAGEAAVRAILAGNDVVLHSPDDAAAVAGIRAAAGAGTITVARIDASVRRILTAKARLGLHKSRTVSLEAVPAVVGSRAHAAVAQALSQKSVTLIKDERGQIPLRVPRESSLLYLSVLDYPANWRIAAPSRTLLPELRRRWPAVTAIELSDRSTADEIELVRASALRYDAIVAGVFVRAASGSGRMDLSAPLLKLLNELGRATSSTARPLVTVLFGNPYVAMGLPSVPAVLLTYDFYDLAEMSAIRALTGEAPLTGRAPISLPGMFDAGHGIARN